MWLVPDARWQCSPSAHMCSSSLPCMRRTASAAILPMPNLLVHAKLQMLSSELHAGAPQLRWACLWRGPYWHAVTR